MFTRPETKSVECTDEELRQRFNDGGYLTRMQQGEFTLLLRREGHPSPPLAEEPFCTKSQIIALIENGIRRANVHQYLRPDGAIGLSGLPDPKALLDGDTLYYVPFEP